MEIKTKWEITRIYKSCEFSDPLGSYVACFCFNNGRTDTRCENNDQIFGRRPGGSTRKYCPVHTSTAFGRELLTQTSARGRPNNFPGFLVSFWPKMLEPPVEEASLSLDLELEPWETLRKTFWILMDDFTFFNLVFCVPTFSRFGICPTFLKFRKKQFWSRKIRH